VTLAEEFAARAVSFDTETWAVPGVVAPPLVLGSIARVVDGEVRGELLDKDQTREAFLRLLEPGPIIVAANLPFDLLVMAVDFARRGVDLMPRIFEKFDRSEVYDVLTAEAVHAVARGHLAGTGRGDPRGGPMYKADGTVTNRYGLYQVVLYNLDRETKVNDEYRLRYREFDGLPLDQLPEKARLYPVDDAVDTHETALAQTGWLERPRGAPNGSGKWAHKNLHDLQRHQRAHWIMHLGAAWGFSTDGVAVEELARRVREARSAELPRWIDLGILRERKPKPEKGEVAVKAPCAHQSEGVCVDCRYWSQDQGLTMGLVARAYGARRPCALCGGEGTLRKAIGCGECAGVGRVPGKRPGTTKKCATCHDGRRTCTACSKTGLDIVDSVVPRTETGRVGIGRDALAESGDDDLQGYAAWSEDAKIDGTYVPFLRKGVEAPLILFPNAVLANGRTSYSDVVQLLPRRGGVRECIVARPGRLFSSTDYPQLELYTHAQSCLWYLGRSELAEALNANRDLHVQLAAAMVGISYEEGMRRKRSDPEFKLLRQVAKPPNYGFPGGMSAAKLVLQQRTNAEVDTPCPAAMNWVTDSSGNRVRGHKGLRFCVLVRGAERCGIEQVTQWGKMDLTPTCRACLEVAEDIRAAWFEAFPENKKYLGYKCRGLISKLLDDGDTITQWVSKRERGGVDYCSAANTFFSGLAADGAKDALYHVGRECYVDCGTALYGSRPITFQHDEILASHPEDVAPEAADRVAEIMEARMKTYIPDVAENFRVEAALMRRWYKGAETIRDDNGRLLAWEPTA
jgi:hypothetical protein